jgi:hypothetical protein
MGWDRMGYDGMGWDETGLYQNYLCCALNMNSKKFLVNFLYSGCGLMGSWIMVSIG